MRQALLLALSLVACKQKEPSRGAIDLTSKDAPEALDAGAPADGAVVAAKLTATQLVAAGAQTCALLSDRTVRCWTAGGPVITPQVHAVLELAISTDRVCARLDDRSVACWSGADPHPVGLLGVTGVDRVFALSGRACGSRSTGSLVCWGSIDVSGRFSTAATLRQPTPFAGVDHVVALLPTAALRDDGTVWSWGADGVPRKRGLEHVVELAVAKDGAICGRLETGAVACVGSTLPCAPKPEPKPAKPTPKKITKKPAKKPAKKAPTVPAPAAAATPTGPVEPVLTLDLPRAKALAFELGLCVVTTAGTLQCGDGCGALESPWKLSRIDAIADRCALSAGHVACWSAPRKVAQVGGIDDATAIAVGTDQACALRRDGSVGCWPRTGPATVTSVAF